MKKEHQPALSTRETLAAINEVKEHLEVCLIQQI
jgi:hypothetical protein